MADKPSILQKSTREAFKTPLQEDEVAQKPQIKVPSNQEALNRADEMIKKYPTTLEEIRKMSPMERAKAKLDSSN